MLDAEKNYDTGLETPDEALVLPAYIPTIEETIKASGGHRQAV